MQYAHGHYTAFSDVSVFDELKNFKTEWSMKNLGSTSPLREFQGWNTICAFRAGMPRLMFLQHP